ncbi:hypothetical protein HBI41_125750 [Parastagonospora nodorum]|nr:hypothetical protein HBI41_125750 [Parastagonospora nodorum]
MWMASRDLNHKHIVIRSRHTQFIPTMNTPHQTETKWTDVLAATVSLNLFIPQRWPWLETASAHVTLADVQSLALTSSALARTHRRRRQNQPAPHKVIESLRSQTRWFCQRAS